MMAVMEYVLLDDGGGVVSDKGNRVLIDVASRSI